ncbi:hypothetical protein D918_07108 [Trichuris suis]|nr:hypothetical protein D918_07108 [Trichuris suis]
MHNCKLFIGNLSPTTTTEALLNFYSQFGKVIECKILRHAVTKESRGFGFVTFSNAEMVDTAMNSRPHFVGGRMVDPRRALPKEVLDETSGPVATNRIFVRGIVQQHDPEKLEEYFSRFGNVTEVTIMIDPTTGKRRGYAVVSFDDYDPVDRAIKAFPANLSQNAQDTPPTCNNKAGLLHVFFVQLATWRLFYLWKAEEL